MSIHVELSSSTESVLRQNVAAAGMSLEQYLGRLAEQDAKWTSDREFPKRASVLTALQILEPLRGKLGTLPSGPLDVDSIYGDC